MADEIPSLHIDTDWKKQAQEEKKKLVEAEAKRAEEQKAPRAAAVAPQGPMEMGMESNKGRGKGEVPGASLGTLVQSMMTQVLYYLGDLAPRGTEPQVNLDLAKHHIDTLTMLEEKTKGNLSGEEQKVLDGALYETRMRFVSVASQLMGP
jgi:hypothetical protein